MIHGKHVHRQANYNNKAYAQPKTKQFVAPKKAPTNRVKKLAVEEVKKDSKEEKEKTYLLQLQLLSYIMSHVAPEDSQKEQGNSNSDTLSEQEVE